METGKGMARILFAWELGGGYGHIDPIYRISEALAARGHEAVFVFRDLVRAAIRAAPGDPILVQAPYFTRTVPWPRSLSVSYSEILLRCGFEDSRGLAGLVEGWLRVIEAAQPDLMLSDHSPTAQLAARIAGLTSVATGTGFLVPPQADPMPSMQPWDPAGAAELTDMDARALAAINAVADRFGAPRLGRVAELFDPKRDLMCTFPELDHYEGREGAIWVGPLLPGSGVTGVEWPEAPGPRVFVYMKGADRGLPGLLAGIVRAGAAALVHAPGVPTEVVHRFADTPVRFSEAPVDMTWVTDHADMVAGNGGHGTVSRVLSAGVPVLSVPQHQEEAFFGYRMAQRGFVALVSRAQLEATTERAVTALANDPAYRARAQSFAEAHRRHTAEAALDAIVGHCETLLGPAPC